MTVAARILFFAVLSSSTFAAEPATVTLPLDEYLRLKKSKDAVEFTSVETVAVTGVYRESLEIKITGGASLPAREIAFMQKNANFDLADCKGSAVLMMKDEQVSLIPQDKRFQVTCRLQVKNWSEVRLKFFNILSLTTKVKGIEPMETPKGSGEREVVLYRADREIAAQQEEEPSAVGYYKIQLLAEENRFDYRISVHNPNSKVKAFTFPLANGEIVQKVVTDIQYKDEKGKISLNLPPGDQQIRIMGRLGKDGFQAPIGKGLEYVLLDQHPLLTSKVDTSAKRISAQDTKMQATFPSPRGYLLSNKDQLTWTKETLKSFAASTYTIRSADYRYYWSPMGKNLVEATFVINNQGATEIPMTLRGTPTYLEINNQPQVLSKNDKDQLVLRIPTGDHQTATIQYKLANDAPRGIASITDSLPRPDAVMTNVAVNLSVPKGFKHFFVSNGIDHNWAMSLWNLMWALLAALFVFKFLMEAQLRSYVRSGAAVAAGLITFFNVNMLVWIFVVMLVATAFKYRARLSVYKLNTWRDYAKVISFGVIVLTGIYIARNVSSYMVHDMPMAMNAMEVSATAGSPPRTTASSSGMRKSMVKAGSFGGPEKADMMEMPVDQAMGSSGAQEELAESDSYEGLPAKVDIPNDGYSVGFSVGLLDVGMPIEIKAVIFPAKLQITLFYLACLFLAFAIWVERRALWRHLNP